MSDRHQNQLVLSSILLLVIVLGVYGCKPEIPPPKPKSVTALVTVLDLSNSTDVGRRCQEFSSRLRTELGRPGVRRLDVLVLGTGGEHTSLEPKLLVPWRRFEVDVGLLEDEGAEEAHREQFLRGAVKSCAKALVRHLHSPIYQAVSRGIASIRQHCAELEGRGYACRRRIVAILSDLRDTGHPILRAEFAGRRARPGKQRAKRVPEELPRIDTSDIDDLLVCGPSNTIALQGGTTIDPQRLTAVWRVVLGRPGLELGTCPRDETLKEALMFRRAGADEPPLGVE